LIRGQSVAVAVAVIVVVIVAVVGDRRGCSAVVNGFEHRSRAR